MKLVLDTNVYCDYAEGLPAVVDTMARFGEFIFIPSVVLGELTYGFMKGKRQQVNERKLQQIIHRLGIDIIDVNANVARKYGLIYLSLERKGMRIPVNDVWIAASCMEVGGTLLTRDRHFAHLEQIEVMIV
jgi:tRNA(fMet)-specific endonuclease VapC